MSDNSTPQWFMCDECGEPVKVDKALVTYHAACDEKLRGSSFPPERAALVDDLLEYADYFKNKNHTDQIGVPTRKLRNRLREAAAALRGETGA